MTDTDVAILRLKSGEDRRLRGGHLWVYSNEVDTQATPLKDLSPGCEAVIEDARGKPLGRALVSPQSLICARLFTRRSSQVLSNSLLKKRLLSAHELRQRFFADESYRLVHAEADGLPGLVIDRYQDVFVMQSGHAGMDQALPRIAGLLESLFAPTAVVVKNDSKNREQQGLESHVEALVGALPEQVSLQENGLEFVAPLDQGQKTAWFYDHRNARRRLVQLARDAKVLDVYSYCGAWGVQAAAHGAHSVTCIDSSALALDHVTQNARLNKVSDRVQTIQGDALATLKQQVAAGEKYDLVILDPPAFIKRKKDFKNGLAGYHTLNELALRLVKPNGYLITASCSMHLGSDQLLSVVQSSARHIDRHVQLLASEGQAEDHPVHPAIPETRYLKTHIFRVLMTL